MGSDSRDMVELSSVPHARAAAPLPAPAPAPAAGTAPANKPFLSLYFACAHAYARAHKRADGSCYEGRCPRCGKSISFPIGEGGTSRRMFEVRCD